MLAEIITFILTFILGTGVFYLLSHFHYKGKPSYPVGIADGWGDALVLPLYNAFTVSLGFFQLLNFKLITYTSIIALIFTLSAHHYFKNIDPYTDWSKPKRGVYNAGGYYHELFFLVQSFIIITSTILFFNSLILWSLLIIYLLLLFYFLKFQLPNRTK